MSDKHSSKPKGNTVQHDFILLDRSGSMQSMWTEALSSINAYVKKLAEEKVDTGVTVAAFDTGSDGRLSFDVLRDRITPPTFRPLSEADAMPRGSTPLNDATGRIVQLAKGGNYDKLALIIMTDGHENASRELSVSQAKLLLDECRGKGWQVIFLGANFDNASQAASYGNLRASSISSTAQNLNATMMATASLRSTYGLTGAAMEYSDDLKKRVGA